MLIHSTDLRVSLDYDAQAFLTGRWSDTKYPLNIRDEDIWPEMRHRPTPRAEITEISLALMRWEMLDALTEFARIAQSPEGRKPEVLEELGEKLKKIEVGLHEKYVKHCRPDDVDNYPEEWATYHISGTVSLLFGLSTITDSAR
jgi:hypothetical protein